LRLLVSPSRLLRGVSPKAHLGDGTQAMGLDPLLSLSLSLSLSLPPPFPSVPEPRTSFLLSPGPCDLAEARLHLPTRPACARIPSNAAQPQEGPPPPHQTRPKHGPLLPAPAVAPATPAAVRDAQAVSHPDTGPKGGDRLGEEKRPGRSHGFQEREPGTHPQKE